MIFHYILIVHYMFVWYFIIMLRSYFVILRWFFISACVDPDIFRKKVMDVENKGRGDEKC